jgi:GT2 family glycosyltransferase
MSALDDHQAVVYTVIPTFNRIDYTRACIRCLQAQTYSLIRIIVADGGSTDGTPERIRDEFPGVAVLRSEQEQWWSGSMAVGINYALRSSKTPDDFVLMMNNDTEFGSDYVETLVRVSRLRNAAVGALIVDSKNPSTILDAGEYIKWESYTFPARTTINDGETYYAGIDVLPGRGTLVPVYMIRKAGSIDAVRFPHYIADYEFFVRLKRNGFPLGITYETRIASHVDTTGYAQPPGRQQGFWKSLHLLVARRSMHNIIDHYRFIHVAAPPRLRGRLQRKVVANAISALLTTFALGRWAQAFLRRTRRLTWVAYAWIQPPYFVRKGDCERLGVSHEDLMQERMLMPIKDDDRLLLSQRRRKLSSSKEAMRLWEYARQRNQRLPRTVQLFRIR